MEQNELPNVAEHEARLERERAEREARIEREKIEWVFCLTGGELNDEPWAVTADGEERTFRHVYDGTPEYAHSELSEDGYQYTTVVSCCLFGAEPEMVVDADGVAWERVASYVSSGETECPLADADSFNSESDREFAAKRPCELCEAQEGEEHGHIYIGEGWSETVYRAKNSDIWPED